MNTWIGWKDSMKHRLQQLNNGEHHIFRLRLQKQSKNAILVCKHFQITNHNFQRDAKITVLEKLMKPAAAEQL